MLVEASVFIGAAIIAVTEAIKDVAPSVKGWVTVVVSAVLGLLVAWLDTELGIVNISPAQGVLIALAGSGVITTAKKI